MTDEPEPLTPEERARLRPQVDVAALERYLARLPRDHRHLTILSFAVHRPPTEVREALRKAGALTEEFDTHLKALIDYRPTPPHLAHPENDPDDNAGRMTWEDVGIGLDVLPPDDDAELAALWRAIEPR